VCWYLYMHLLHMIIHLYCILRCKEEFFYISRSYNFVSVFCIEFWWWLNTKPKHVAKGTSCIYVACWVCCCHCEMKHQQIKTINFSTATPLHAFKLLHLLQITEATYNVSAEMRISVSFWRNNKPLRTQTGTSLYQQLHFQEIQTARRHLTASLRVPVTSH
jgi:hypothetical protein